jgi:pyruvate kinase
MHHHRKAKIVATLGPASATPERIRSLFKAGVDVFRLNFSFGTHEEHRQRSDAVRALEREVGRPIGVLVDLQGPKLRVGTFVDGRATLATGAKFELDLDAGQGDQYQVSLPHKEVFEALSPGVQLLLDDGKIRLLVETCNPRHAVTRVVVGGVLSDHKGLSVVGAVLKLSALTPKDRLDLACGLELGADWIALSFVQRPADVAELRSIVAGRAGVMTKLEKPAAIEHLDAIVALSDAVMVARGDLGVEMLPEDVPAIQRRILQACRQAGKPSIVATQMLESMILVPSPTRAEVSDVATAVYLGADAVMLSAESASGAFPVEAVAMMDRVIVATEADKRAYRPMIDAGRPEPVATIPDAICAALRAVTSLVPVAATVSYTMSGATSLRVSRERLATPILSVAATQAVARRLTLAWGIHSLHAPKLANLDLMTEAACELARSEGLAVAGDTIVVAAGTPIGVGGTTNMLKIIEA